MNSKRKNEREAIGLCPEGFSSVPGFLTEAEQQELLGLLEALDFKHDKFRGQELKRSYAQFGHAYVSTGRKLDPAPPWPGFLVALARKGLPHCPEGTPFDQCIVTHYPKGAGIGWHPDAPCFGDCIMAVSIGAEGWLQFRPNGSKEATYELRAGPGSLYVMLGAARWDYQHQVTAVKKERYSVTFRHVADPNAG